MKHCIAAVMAVLSVCLPAAASTAELPDVRIDYRRHVLDNGLTLLIHEDRKAPIVAVNLWYHVGSKDERPGRTGFAHLFEHLMFNGSENFNDEFFRPLEPAGATKMNGTTWFDRTNYFQNVPTSALDLTLWLESDRMGHLLGAIDQAKLDEQREVVLNEKRQAENRPYGKVWEMISQAAYPAGHPYSWSPIGSYEDLGAATLDDVKAWFNEHYGAANAVLVIAGDVDADEVKKKVEHYFGDIPSGPVRKRHAAWVAKMSGDKRIVLQDRVPQTRIVKVWNVPGFCESEANLLGIAAGVLGDGKNSRLYERLVYRDRIATSVGVGMGPFEIGSQFLIDVMVAPDADAAAAERAVDEELARFLRDGPTEDELERLRVKTFAQAIRGLERVDGFDGKSATLAQYQVYCGSPERYTDELREIRAAQPQTVRDIARHWLADGVLTLTVEPFPEYTVAASSADRSRLPALGEAPDLNLPPLQRAQLSNGLKLVLAERHDAPVVQLSLIADGGYAADAGIKAGTARLALDLLDEGAGDDDALALAARAERLGAQISAGSSLDTSFLNLNALRLRLEPSLDVFADVLLRPRFAADDLERLRQQQLAAIRQEKAQPLGLATRLYPRLIYGEDHAYGMPRSGTGNEDSVQAITLDDLRGFYSRWLRPDTATLLLVGDTTLEEIVPLLEQRLGGWQAPDSPPPAKQLADVALPEQPRLFLVNRTAAEQTLILAAHVAPPRSDPEDLAMQVANTVLGGNFVSRLNMNLREDKRWSYGASTGLSGAKAQRPFYAYAPVQSDKTVESLREIRRELEAIRGRAPITADELAFARDSLVRSLPGENETAGDVAQSYTSVLVHELPDSYWNDYVDDIGALQLSQVNAAVQRLVQPQGLTWVIVGDLARIEQPVRALGWGEVSVLDADGNKLR
jgi:zinc protease